MLSVAGVYPVTRAQGQDRWPPTPFSFSGYTGAWLVIYYRF